VLAGPHTGNFEDIFRALFAAQGVGRITSGEELAQLARRLLQDSEEAARIGEQAKAAADRLGGALAHTLEATERLLANARA
jgi:3-deoxy-D-manno-octulosonic-acid transferase